MNRSFILLLSTMFLMTLPTLSHGIMNAVQQRDRTRLVIDQHVPSYTYGLYGCPGLPAGSDLFTYDAYVLTASGGADRTFFVTVPRGTPLPLPSTFVWSGKGDAPTLIAMTNVAIHMCKGKYRGNGNSMYAAVPPTEPEQTCSVTAPTSVNIGTLSGGESKTVSLDVKVTCQPQGLGVLLASGKPGSNELGFKTGSGLTGHVLANGTPINREGVSIIAWSTPVDSGLSVEVTAAPDAPRWHFVNDGDRRVHSPLFQTPTLTPIYQDFLTPYGPGAHQSSPSKAHNPCTS